MLICDSTEMGGTQSSTMYSVEEDGKAAAPAPVGAVLDSATAPVPAKPLDKPKLPPIGQRDVGQKEKESNKAYEEEVERESLLSRFVKTLFCISNRI